MNFIEIKEEAELMKRKMNVIGSQIGPLTFRMTHEKIAEQLMNELIDKHGQNKALFIIDYIDILQAKELDN